jgi:hypothetical protein
MIRRSPLVKKMRISPPLFWYSKYVSHKGYFLSVPMPTNKSRMGLSYYRRFTGREGVPEGTLSLYRRYVRRFLTKPSAFVPPEFQRMYDLSEHASCIRGDAYIRLSSRITYYRGILSDIPGAVFFEESVSRVSLMVFITLFTRRQWRLRVFHPALL